MRLSIFAASLLIATTSAFANVQSGTFTGTDKSGESCQFTLLPAWFEDNMHHPLTERQPVEKVQFANANLAQVIWNMGHVQTVDSETGKIGFVHSQFQQVIATKTGAAAMVLDIDETERPEGHTPKRLVYFENNFRDSKQNVRYECNVQ